MVSAKQHVLVVGVSSPALQRAGSLLSRGALRVNHVASGRAAVALMQATPFDLVVVRHPLNDTDMTALIGAVRAPECGCRGASVLVLAEDGSGAELSALIGHGVNRILPINAPSDRLLATVAELLAVAPRRAMRVPVQLSLLCEQEGESWEGGTVNVSRTGMLVVSGHLPPVGSGISFVLFLPDDTNPLSGSAEVVRHADAPAGSFAVRYVSFSVDSWQRLHNFLATP